MAGVGQVLHICPPMHPQEDTIARTMIELAREQSVERFVLYSVLHPLLADVPHHARKLEAERALIGSELNYTILQPSRYMQHLVPIWKAVLATGVHSMPFGTTARFSVVDLADLAEATARIMTEPGHEGATYQLAGPRPLSQDDMAEILTRVLGRPIRAQAKPLDEFRRDAAAAGMPAERIETMCQMNAHYDAHGLIGNPNVLRWILNREPTALRCICCSRDAEVSDGIRISQGREGVHRLAKSQSRHGHSGHHGRWRQLDRPGTACEHWPGYFPERSTDAPSAPCIPKRRNRKVVAHRQGGELESGVNHTHFLFSTMLSYFRYENGHP